ncbi:hypothetical protein D3C79_1038230 [compost metagenome]
MMSRSLHVTCLLRKLYQKAYNWFQFANSLQVGLKNSFCKRAVLYSYLNGDVIISFVVTADT